jgi:ABC-type glycerol-3-phosphate transport system substrate-binding protein
LKAGLVWRSAAALAALLLLSLAGCLDSKEPPQPTFKGALTLWAAPGLAGYPAATAVPDAGWFSERARAFEALHPEIKVELRLFPTPAELEQALTVPAAGTTGPDLAFGRVLPELAPRLAQQIPALLDVQALALNEAAFAAAGVDLPQDGNWTLVHFEDSLKRLSGPNRFGLGLYHLPGYHEWYPLAGGIFRPDGSLDDGAAAGLERLVRYSREGWLDPDTAKVRAEETWAAFASGRIAILPVGSWAIPLLRAEPYNVKLTVAGFPGGANTGYAYGSLLFRQEDQLKKGAAIDLANFLATPDQQVRLARQTGLMPAAPGAGNPFEGDAAMSSAFKLVPPHIPLPAGPRWEQAEARIARELRYALIGGKAPGAVLEAITTATAPTSK